MTILGLVDDAKGFEESQGIFHVRGCHHLRQLADVVGWAAGQLAGVIGWAVGVAAADAGTVVDAAESLRNCI